ncbi:MAG: hypothetical protein ACRDI2_04955 [Chloroflexota bacterium]
MISPEATAAIVPVANVLEGLGVMYHIGGSVASSAYGFPRSTMDVDLVADLRAEHVRPLVEQLHPIYYVDENAVREAVQRQRSFNVIHLQTMVKVDVFVPRQTPFDRSALARARPLAVDVSEGARSFPFKSPEDLILRKLEWYRAGGEVSERQWNDVLGVLRVQGTALDQGYLQHWAEQLGLTDLLEQALSEAGL